METIYEDLIIGQKKYTTEIKELFQKDTDFIRIWFSERS